MRWLIPTDTLQLRQNPDASKAAVKAMSKNVKARLAVKTTKCLLFDDPGQTFGLMAINV